MSGSPIMAVESVVAAHGRSRACCRLRARRTSHCSGSQLDRVRAPLRHGPAARLAILGETELRELRSAPPRPRSLLRAIAERRRGPRIVLAEPAPPRHRGSPGRGAHAPQAGPSRCCRAGSQRAPRRHPPRPPHQRRDPIEARRVPRPPAAALWGLLRSAQSEHPGRFALIDTDGSEARRALCQSLPPAEEPQLALREGVALVARAWSRAHSGARDARPIDPSRTILITGGTGGLGAHIARHLAEAARRPPPAPRQPKRRKGRGSQRAKGRARRSWEPRPRSPPVTSPIAIS